MFIRCRECNIILNSKIIRDTQKLTYAVDQMKWHDCIDGRGSNKPDYTLDDSDEIVVGYCGCKGWP